MAYTVKPGDTLAQIAAKLGITDWRELFVNGVAAGETNPRLLQIGSVITTPEEQAAAAPVSDDGSPAAPLADTPRDEVPTTAPEGTPPASMPAPGQTPQLPQPGQTTAPSGAPPASMPAPGSTPQLPQPGRTTASPAGSSGVRDDDVGTVAGQIVEEPTDGLGNEEPVIRATGILDGGSLIRVQREGRMDLYYMLYAMGNGQWVYYEFDNYDGNGDGKPDILFETFGGFPPNFTVISEEQHNRRDGVDFTRVGDAAEIIGMVGNFQQLLEDRKRQAITAMGLRDPSASAALVNDPDYINLITRFSFPGANMTEAQFVAELRNLDVYRNVVYPGIDFFYDRGDANPEAAWRSYQSNVEPELRRLGIATDGDNTYKNTIRDMLNSGISDAEFVEFAPIIERIQANPSLRTQMNAWAQHELGRSLNFDEFIDVLAGTTDPELNRVIESATLAFNAEQVGVNISVAEIRRIAQNTDLSEQAALNSFTEFDRALLAIGDQDLGRHGISRQALIDSFTGVEPEGGLSSVSVRNVANKLAQERGISDSPRASFFVNFSDAGQPFRQGLGGLSQIGG